MPLKPEVLSKYKNNIFIESGSFLGDGIKCSIECGFSTIYSAECHESNCKFCINRFKDNPNVNLYFGDSREMLKILLPSINERCTFWLDGHYSRGGTGYIDIFNPIVEELEIISNHHIKDHFLLIDDRRNFDTDEFLYLGEDKIKELVLKINPNYKFEYCDGFVPSDILACTIL